MKYFTLLILSVLASSCEKEIVINVRSSAISNPTLTSTLAPALNETIGTCTFTAAPNGISHTSIEFVSLKRSTRPVLPLLMSLTPEAAEALGLFGQLTIVAMIKTLGLWLEISVVTVRLIPHS